MLLKDLEVVSSNTVRDGVYVIFQVAPFSQGVGVKHSSISFYFLCDVEFNFILYITLNIEYESI